jgi:hypothetical protein
VKPCTPLEFFPYPGSLQVLSKILTGLHSLSL